jgi:hypothetical protein
MVDSIHGALHVAISSREFTCVATGDVEVPTLSTSTMCHQIVMFMLSQFRRPSLSCSVGRHCIGFGGCSRRTGVWLLLGMGTGRASWTVRKTHIWATAFQFTEGIFSLLLTWCGFFMYFVIKFDKHLYKVLKPMLHFACSSFCYGSGINHVSHGCTRCGILITRFIIRVIFLFEMVICALEFMREVWFNLDV